MTRVSTNHHYIPEFYLKNFTNDNQEFYIYLVKEKRFKKNGKLFSPSSHFFTKHGNTVDIEDRNPDFLETDHYSPLDNEVALLFEKIKTSSNLNKFGLSDLDVVKLDYFFAQLFWRNPKHNDRLKELIKLNPLKSFGFKVVDSNNNEVDSTEVEKIFKNKQDSYKLIKYWLPLATFKNTLTHNQNFHIIPFPTKGLPGLLGDNPIIFKDPNNDNTYIEDLVVPITKEIVYIRTSSLDNKFHSSTKVLIDLLQLRQANEFVCCTDKNYINQLNSLFESKIKDDQLLRQLIFYDIGKKNGG